MAGWNCSCLGRWTSHERLLRLIDVAVDAVNPTWIHGCPEDRISSSRVADGEEMVIAPHDLERLEIHPACVLVREVSVWKQQGDQVVHDAHASRPVPPGSRGHERIEGMPLVWHEKETRREEYVDRRKVMAFEFSGRTPSCMLGQFRRTRWKGTLRIVQEEPVVLRISAGEFEREAL
jgi:hypothetical protein